MGEKIMFYLVEIEKNITVPPKILGSTLKNYIENKIQEETEDTCTDFHGCIVAIHAIKHIGDGIVQYETGSVSFVVQFECITYKPKVNEVVDIVVHELLETFVIGSYGPGKVLINKN